MKQPKLRVGDPAPHFTTTDALGGVVNLADYRKNFVLVVFLRYSGCPWCNLTIHRLSLEYPMLKKNGCEVIAFVQSAPANVVKNIYGRQPVRPPYPIIGDHDREFYDRYGVGLSLKAAAKSIIDIPYWLKSAYGHGFHQSQIDGNLLLVPATFLVSPGE